MNLSEGGEIYNLSIRLNDTLMRSLQTNESSSGSPFSLSSTASPTRSSLLSPFPSSASSSFSSASSSGPVSPFPTEDPSPTLPPVVSTSTVVSIMENLSSTLSSLMGDSPSLLQSLTPTSSPSSPVSFPGPSTPTSPFKDSSPIEYYFNSTTSTNSFTNGTSYGGDEEKPDKVYWALLLSILPICAIIGNILVIMSVYTEKSLRSVTNYFIVSLAFADLLVASCVMPFAVYFQVNVDWELSETICDFWIAFDVTLSTASILNLVAISIDRFMAVTMPIRYATYKSNNRVSLTISLVWIISVCIGSPIVLGLNTSPERTPELCIFYNSDFIIYSSLGSFYIPCCLMVFLYYKIFKALRERARRKIGGHDFKKGPNAPTPGSITAGPGPGGNTTGTATSDPPGNTGSNTQVGIALNKRVPPSSDKPDPEASEALVIENVAETTRFIEEPTLTLIKEPHERKPDTKLLQKECTLSSQDEEESSSDSDDEDVEGDGDDGGPDFDDPEALECQVIKNHGVEEEESVLLNGRGPITTTYCRTNPCINTQGTNNPQHLPLQHPNHPQSPPPTSTKESPSTSSPSSSSAGREEEGVTRPASGLNGNPDSGYGPSAIHIEETQFCLRNPHVDSVLQDDLPKQPPNPMATSQGATPTPGNNKHPTKDDQGSSEKDEGAESSDRTHSPVENGSRTGTHRDVDDKRGSLMLPDDEKKRKKLRFHLRRKTKSGSSQKKKEKLSAKRERKATKTLAIVLGVFLICWVPFFTCNIIDAICIKLEKPDCRLSTTAFLLTTWLGYMNSIVNPVIYTVFNPEFRKAFKRILGFK